MESYEYWSEDNIYHRPNCIYNRLKAPANISTYKVIEEKKKPCASCIYQEFYEPVKTKNKIISKNNEIIFYGAETSKKYHLESCGYNKNNSFRKLLHYEVSEREPCSQCEPNKHKNINSDSKNEIISKKPNKKIISDSKIERDDIDIFWSNHELKKYHYTTCEYADGKSPNISINFLKKNPMLPCKVCDPEIISGIEKDDKKIFWSNYELKKYHYTTCKYAIGNTPNISINFLKKHPMLPCRVCNPEIISEIEEDDEKIFWSNREFKKYHHKTCEYAAGKTPNISLKFLKENPMLPCRVCNPEIISETEEDDEKIFWSNREFKKYHHKTCEYAAGKTPNISLKFLKKNPMLPCSVCNPKIIKKNPKKKIISDSNSNSDSDSNSDVGKRENNKEKDMIYNHEKRIKEIEKQIEDLEKEKDNLIETIQFIKNNYMKKYK